MADENGVWTVGPLSEAASGLTSGEGLVADLADMLRQSNGFAMWGGAFVVLPSGSDVAVPSLETYNGAWKDGYPEAVRKATFFALDVFGFPFGLSEGKVVQLDPETGELRQVAESLGRLLNKVETDANATIGLSVFDAWCGSGREMALGQRLAPKIPFVFGGGKEISDLYAADLMERAAFNAHIYSQIKDMPDGTTVELKVVQ